MCVFMLYSVHQIYISLPLIRYLSNSITFILLDIYIRSDHLWLL